MEHSKPKQQENDSEKDGLDNETLFINYKVVDILEYN